MCCVARFFRRPPEEGATSSILSEGFPLAFATIAQILTFPIGGFGKHNLLSLQGLAAVCCARGEKEVEGGEHGCQKPAAIKFVRQTP